MQQTRYIGRCIQEGFESFEAGRGAVKQLGDTFFCKGDTFACAQPKDVLAVVFVCRLKSIILTHGDWEPFPLRSIANTLVTAVEAKMGQSSGNLCSLRVILEA